MRKRFLLAAALAAALIPAQALAATWTIDSGHSTASFTVTHLTITTVPGKFGKMTGTIQWDEADITKSSVESSIDTTTITTENDQRDTHLKSPDFFDVAKYPTMTFKSTKIEKSGNGLKVTGDLTMRGVTKPVVFDVTGPAKPITDPWGNTKSGLKATATVNRQDFGISWSKTLDSGGLVVGNDVSITVDLEITKSK